MNAPGVVVEQIEVSVQRLSNGVERLLSAEVRVGVPHVPRAAAPLDLDDGMVRDFLFAAAKREGFEIPEDRAMGGGVWLDSDRVIHIRAWLA